MLASLVACFAAIDRLAARPASGTRRDRAVDALLTIACGLAFGFASVAIASSYLPEVTGAYFGLGPRRRIATYLVFSAYHGIEHMMVYVLAVAALRRGAPLAWSLLVPLAVLEWAFPRVGRVYLAGAVSDLPPVAAIASLGGPVLVGSFLIGVAAVLYELGRAAARRQTPTRGAWLAPGALAVALLAAASAPLALSHGEPLDRWRVLVAQPNIDPRDHATRAETERVLAAMTSDALAREPTPDLIVWPESALVALLPENPTEALGARAFDLPAPLLFGGVIASADGRPAFNSALVIDRDGALSGRYDKVGLMPFSESLPLASVLPDGTASALGLHPARVGERSPLLEIGGRRIGVMICYEDLLPELLYDAFRDEPVDLLVAISNDGWFGDSAAIGQHLALARYRAIEWGVPLLRVTQTGATVLLDARGRAIEAMPPHERHAATWDVPFERIPTPFRILGPWPGPVAAILGLVWLFARRRSAA
jgi:apolipoprotein N-acyltransferase